MSEKKQIILKSSRSTNFKGTASLSIDYSKETFIFGANGSGKTSVLDAYLWCLFGKDSTGSAKFNIIPLDKNGKPKKKVEAEVEQVFQTITGELVEDHVFRKIHRQKWSKKKGEEEESYSGNENVYFYNDVPMKAEDYSKKVESIIKETVLTILSNVTHFNGMPWKEQREILISLIPEVKDSEVVKLNPEFVKLQEDILGKNKSFEEFKNEAKAKIKKSKEEVKLIPARIHENNSYIVEHDFEQLKADKVLKEAEIAKIDKTLYSGNEQIEAISKKVRERDTSISELNDSINTTKKAIWSRLKNERDEAQRVSGEFFNRITFLDDLVKDLNSKITSEEATIKQNEEFLDSLRKLWAAENDKEAPVLSGDETKCFHCSQDLPVNMLNDPAEAAKISFNNKKAEAIRDITKKAEVSKSNIQASKNVIANYAEQIAAAEEELKNPENKSKAELYAAQLEKFEDIESVYALEIESNEDIKSFAAKIEELNSLEFDKEDDSSAEERNKLIQQKEVISKEINDLTRSLAAEETNKQSLERIEKLEAQQKTLSQEIANLEKVDFLISSFERQKMDLIEKRVNKLFKFISFRLFEDTKTTGAQTPTCEAMINGVPYSDANTASKINAGVDVINMLSTAYNITAPVFIDNRESVTDIIDTDSQLISLIVSANDSKIRVQSV